MWGDEPLATLLDAVIAPDWDELAVPDQLRALAQTQSPTTLRVVRAFLDLAGNVHAVAERLPVHRSTVYYHLGRFRDGTGFDLDDGRTRLLLHLWFHIHPPDADG